jgi:hypothetical protein
VARGIKIKHSLYKIDVSLCEQTNDPKSDSQTSDDRYVFTTDTNTQTWETWHKRFGHIGYKGLQRLKDLNLVQGLSVDPESPKLDCVACTEAKQTQEPYKKLMRTKRDPGELTHIDVWGKYDTVSIGGYQYYILLVDDGARYVTVHFLKKKDEASSKVMEYLTYLRTQNKFPKVI